MSFQLGGYGVQRWKGMCSAILKGDWQRAGDEMEWSDATKKQKRSAWWTQTRSRCEKSAHAMRTGSFKPLTGIDPKEVTPIEALSIRMFTKVELIEELLRREQT